MAKWNFIGARRRHDVSTQKAGNGVAAVLGDRCIQMKRFGASGVPLPSKRDNSVAVAKEPGVPGSVRQILIAPVHERKNVRETAVGILEKQRSVASGRILRTQRDKFSGKFYFAVLKIHGVGEVDDRLVVRIGDRNREINFAADAFIRA